MTKKFTKKIAVGLAIMLLMSNSMFVFAANEEFQKNNEIQTISIDAQKAVSTSGKTLEEVLGNSSMTRATKMPEQTWDWSQGDYTGWFEIDNEYSYTLYNFTGYSQYYVNTKASRDKWTAASDNYTVYLMKGSGQGTIVTQYSFNSTDWTRVRFYNLDSGTKYAVCFSKANDGSTLSGDFSVSH